MLMRQRDGKWETQDSHELENWTNGEAHLDECLTFMKDHTGVDFQVTSEPDYGGDRVMAVLTGWRYCTEKEITDKETEDAKWATKIRETEEAQVARLRESRPDLFK